MDLPLLTLLLVLALAFANGTNDVSKAIATLVGSGVTNSRKAIAWGTFWTMVGAAASAFVATAMVKTFSTGLIRPDETVPPALAPGVLSGTVLWVLLASRVGLPVSTTHALTGSLVGAGLLAYGREGLVWETVLNKIVLPLLLSPFLSLGVACFLHPLLRLIANRWEGLCVCVMPHHRALVTIDGQGYTRTLYQVSGPGIPVVSVPSQCDRAGLSGPAFGVDSIHWLSSGLTSLARGTNDAPKIAAMLLLGSLHAMWPSPTLQMLAFAGVAAAMGAGSYCGGQRVTEVLAERVTTMNHVEGLSANLTTSSLVLLSGSLGLPVSTTHLCGSAIIGIGLLRGKASVHWATVRDMVLAWIVTAPVSATLACLAYFLFSRTL
ncbi:MAG: inorganic phosphate transporter [Nitrospira sp.]|nr:inorganic phosphate transporter [Nitrospira sp.]MDH4305326.1 inorganic phosphate transporter [Nitrospira sp.]MDH5193954.1 inorganic phosphate transporter [Nitrospira sp.]